eukprot:3615293-Prymnesium_polylepis.1
MEEQSAGRVRALARRGRPPAAAPRPPPRPASPPPPPPRMPPPPPTRLPPLPFPRPQASQLFQPPPAPRPPSRRPWTERPPSLPPPALAWCRPRTHSPLECILLECTRAERTRHREASGASGPARLAAA